MDLVGIDTHFKWSTSRH